MTRGIPSNLTRLLENLQAYRELPPPYREDQRANAVSPKIVPVEYFHFIGKYGGQQLQILGRRARSRSASGRSNLIVHLVTHFSTDFHKVPMRMSAGPAAESRVIPWTTSWSYEAEPTFQEDSIELEPSRIAERICRRCERWESIAGDAGWAAIPVEAALQGQKVALIVPRTGDWSQVALELFDESLQLMEPTTRWSTGFSTYWTGTMPTGLQCHWRLIYDDTAEAISHRRQPDIRCLELGAPMGAPEPSWLVELARTGGDAAWIGSGVNVTDTSDAALENVTDIQRSTTSHSSHADPDDEQVYRVRPLPPSKRAHRLIERRRSSKRIEDSSPSQGRSRIWGILSAMACGSVLAGIVGIICIGIWSPSPNHPATGEKRSNRPEKSEIGSAPPGPETLKRTDNQENVAAKSQHEHPAARSTDVNVASAGTISPPSPLQNNSQLGNILESRQSKAFDDIRKRHCRLKVPVISIGSIATAKPNRELATLAISSAEDLKLELIGANTWLSGKSLELSEVQGDRKWIVRRLSNSSVGEDVIGEFKLDSGPDECTLGFTPSPNKSTDELQFCWLGLKYHEEKILCALRDFDHTKDYFNWNTLNDRMSTDQSQLIKLPKIAEKRAIERVRVKLFVDGPFRAVAPPAELSHDRSINFEIDVDETRVPFEVKMTVTAKEAKLTWNRSIRLKQINENTGEITEPKVVPPNESDRYVNQTSVQEKINSCKSKINDLEAKKAAAEKAKADVRPIVAVIENWKRCLRAYEDNKESVKRMADAYSKLSDSNNQSRIGIHLLWDTGDELKGWPNPPDDSLPLNILSSPAEKAN